ncbi:DUF4142 domain-containing protein [Chitinophaga rhizophila]|uniref:DUF4142 domain-containing protein n=1 Tax=Chitinophaga rhizophila TaxID=2866212 RepID=A0ABS7G7W9_9BACT|nr:DUF4142 domain-containing protein [Chitinophaga rhizophila]MBW8682889.1 DUF4142 domain-containing protein [Chitinophaga rhizophila]
MTNLKHFLAAGLVTFACVFAGCSDDDDDMDNPMVTREDQDFMMKASHGNWAEGDMGKVADSLSNDGGVKMYGRHMQEDHSKAQAELKGIADGWDVDVPEAPDSLHFVMRQQMSRMTPEMFDTTYIKGQIADHIKTIALFENAATNANRQQLRDYANKHLPAIKMHKAMADTMMLRLMAR